MVFKNALRHVAAEGTKLEQGTKEAPVKRI